MSISPDVTTCRAGRNQLVRQERELLINTVYDAVRICEAKWHGRPAREYHAQDARATSGELTGLFYSPPPAALILLPTISAPAALISLSAFPPSSGFTLTGRIASASALTLKPSFSASSTVCFTQ